MVFLLFLFLSDPAPAIPRFPITEIKVDGARWVSHALVISESGLKIGESYSEKELALARGRIARLPFVLHADFSLDKGEKRGFFTLVIHVREHRLLFHHYNYSFRKRDLPNPLPLRGPGSAEDLSQDAFGNWGLGGRWFLGAYGFAYLTTTLEQVNAKLDFAPGKPVDLGYSHYNLLGTGLFLNVNLQVRSELDQMVYDPFSTRLVRVVEDRSPATTLTLAQPFSNRSQWISLTLDFFENELAFPNGDDFVEVVDEKWFRSSLSWYMDTTNDLSLPTRGRRLEAGLDYGRVTSQFPVQVDHAVEYSPNYEVFTVEALDLRLELAQYHPFTEKLSVYATGVFRTRIQEKGTFLRNPDQTRYQIRSGVDYKIWGADSVDGELRLECFGSHMRRSDDFGHEEIQTLQTGLVFRNSWGLVRAGFQYQHVDVFIGNEESSAK